MAFVLKDRVKQTSTSNGQNDLTLNGSVDGFSDFSVLSNGDTTFYALLDGNNWEVGIGTYLTSGPTLQRTTVLDTSAGNTTKISCSSDAKQVFITQPAGKAVFEDASDNVNVDGIVTAAGFSGKIHPVNGTTTNYLSLKDSNELNFLDSSNQSIKLYINYDGGDVDIAGSTILATHGSEVVLSDSAVNYGKFRSSSGTFTIQAIHSSNPNITYQGNTHIFDNSDGSVEYMRISSDGLGLGVDPANARGGFTDLVIGQGGETGQGSTQPQIELYHSSASWAINNDSTNSNQMGFHYNNGSTWSQRLALTPTNAVFAGDIELNTTSGSVNWGTSEGEIGYSSGYGRLKAKNIGTSGGQNQDTVAKWYRPEGSQYRFELDANGSNWSGASCQYVANAKDNGFASLNFRKDNNDGIMSLSGRNLPTGTYTSLYLGTDGLSGGTEIWKADDAVGSYGGTAYSNKSFNIYEATYFSKRATIGADKGGYETALSPHPFELMVSSVIGDGSNTPTIALYNDAGGYHSGLIQYDTNVLKLGLNNANAANNLLTNTAVNIGSDGVGIGATPESNVLKLGGSLTGGIKFNDGTTQSTAASGGASVGKIIALGLAFG